MRLHAASIGRSASCRSLTAELRLKTGDFAEILGYSKGNAHYRAKLLALGLTRGAQIKVVGVAPLGVDMI